MVEDRSSNGVSLQGGFVTLPAVAYAPDAAGKIVDTGGLMSTTATPVLHGSYGEGSVYDVPANRWLPVDSADVSPDGMTYAYGTSDYSTTSAIHVVTVSSGADKAFKLTLPAYVAYATPIVESFDGRYAYYAIQAEGFPSGMWRLDTDTGSIVAMAQVMSVLGVRDAKAWFGTVDPHDPTPPSVPYSVQGLFDSLVQVDLATGAQTTWFYRPGVAVSLLAVDGSGRPLVAVNDGPDFENPSVIEVRHLTNPLSGGEDNGDLIYSGPLSLAAPVVDGDRIWFGSDRGVYLYTPAGGLQKIYAFASASHTIFPGGPCR